MNNRLESIKDQWESFKKNHRDIMVLEVAATLDKKLEQYFTEEYYTKVEEFYIDCKSQIQEDAARLRGKGQIPTQNMREDEKEEEKSTPNQGLKLPRINLPTFDGDYKIWKAFFDLYSTLIHNNKSLTPVQKLHYLKASLLGDAEQLLRHFTTTDANYQPAWNLLIDRYDNPRVLIKTQLKTLLSQPYVTQDTAKGIRNLMDTTNECVQALNNLGVNTKDWDIILTYIVSERLSPDTKKLWEQSTGSKREFPAFVELKTFLEGQFRALESLSGNIIKTKQLTHKHNFQALKTYSCAFCSGPHPLRHCTEFLKLDHSSKRNVVIQKHLCSNCLAKGHNALNCPSKTSCFKCKHRHHTLLHSDQVIADKTRRPLERSFNDEKSGDQKPTTLNSTPSASQLHVGNVSVGNEVLLATALIKIIGKNGHNIIIRALVDQGSQASFPNESIIQRLHLKGTPVTVNISGLGDTKTGVAKAQVNVELQPLRNTLKIHANVFVLKNLNTILPPRTIKKRTSWTHIKGLNLADPNYHQPGKIDMIIGADIFGKILLDGLRTGPNGSLIAQNTVLGWILSGEIEGEQERALSISSYHCQISLDEQLRKFWELEEVLPIKHLTEEEKMCEKQFCETVKRSEDGRYIVRLPFRIDPTLKLGRSRCIALSRFRSTELTFSKSEEFRHEYTKCMEEYLKLHHMEMVTTSEVENMHVDKNNNIFYATNYLPHHAVIKDSTTTKLRVVFDASAKTIGGPSLNDALLTGPTLQDDLMTILLRWRKHQVVITADIEKMYRQIWVSSEDSEYQRILWRKSPSEPINDYKLKTVTFGTSSAPYLAVRTLHQLAKDEIKNYPIASSVAFSDFYVDDLLTGTSTIEGALKVQGQMIDLLRAGGFNLRKWASNKTELLENIPSEDKELSGVHNLSFDEKVKTLGINWYPRLDSFKYTIAIKFDNEAKITKRKFLSDISKLFDPLGFLSPITIKPKMLMQAIWLTGISWDEEIPEDILHIWQKVCSQFKEIERVEIPRWVHTPTNSAAIHGFCDGSLHAYAAVLYVRSIDTVGNIKVTLLAAKTKVTPIKQISLPRVELCGATLLTRLFKAVTTSMKFEHVSFHAWTDSTIVLSWIQGHPNKYKTFVANRIAEIQETCSNDVWNYVPTGSNPADCATRGLFPAEAVKHNLWWNGPDWLKKSEEFWPSVTNLKETNLETKTIKVNLITRQEDSSIHLLIHKYSSLAKLIRITGYCFRFISRCQAKQLKGATNWLTSSELDTALVFWIKQAQAQEFEPEINNLQSNKNLKTGQLSNLNPFLDNDCVLRVGGRLQNANISWAERHPIILPNRHRLTDLIIDDMHKSTLHGGPQLMLGLLRRKFWILRARSTVRMRIHKCITCFRQRAQCCSQLMGNLPGPRANISRPFSHVGVDYCGPLEIKTSRLRNARKEKCYLAIFVCLAVNAIHIEVVTELTTQGFLAAFKRFTGRRGMCSDIYSDNGTNFGGARAILDNDFKQHLRQLMKNMPEHLATKGITWHFIPPAAPHFGGLWESAVKSTKFHLKRILGNVTLTFEELTTLTVQIEACLNSRPLCPLTNDATDLTALTPGHFLIGAPLLSIPEPSYLEQKEHRLNRWQYIQQIIQSFWKRWQSEYLSQLQQRSKWNTKIRNLKKGDIVLVKDEKLPPCSWLLARIVDTHPGTDNLVRVVSIQTKNNVCKRPVAKLCVLPIEDNSTTDADGDAYKPL